MMNRQLLFGFLVLSFGFVGADEIKTISSEVHDQYAIPQVSQEIKSEIITTNNIADVLKYVDDKTVVIFDIDGVLFETPQTLGNDAWAMTELKKHITLAGDVNRGIQTFIPPWNELQNNLSMKLVDPQIFTVLQTLREKKSQMFGFTARGMALVERTKQQLTHVGIDLSVLPWHDKELQQETFAYQYNIVFARDSVDKGAYLKNFFDAVNRWPTKIVFIDDNPKNVEKVKAVADAAKIPFVGIHYQQATYYHVPYDALIGDLEYFVFNHFRKIISDEQAGSILEKIKEVITLDSENKLEKTVTDGVANG